MTRNAHAPSADWIDRLYDAAPLPPIALGVMLAVGWGALFSALATWTGEFDVALARGLEIRDMRIGITLTLLIGYTPTAQRYLERATQRNLAALAEAMQTGIPAASGRGQRPVIALALLLIPLAGLIVDRDPTLYLRAGYWGTGTLWTWSTGLLFGWTFGRFAYATLAASRRMSELATRLRRVDLFDRGWLAPYARQGLLCALLWLGIPALFALNLVDEPVLYVLLPLTLICAAIGAAALLLPSLGVRRRLQAAKQAELARVRRALRGDAQALAGSPIAARPEPSLADLLAYEGFLRQIPVWPFDQATWLRLALYLLLPLGSWFGGALVERLLGSWLDGASGR